MHTIAFLIITGLTNLIPSYSSDDGWNCPNYKYYKSYEIERINGYFEFRNYVVHILLA